MDIFVQLARRQTKTDVVALRSAVRSKIKIGAKYDFTVYSSSRRFRLRHIWCTARVNRCLAWYVRCYCTDSHVKSQIHKGIPNYALAMLNYCKLLPITVISAKLAHTFDSKWVTKKASHEIQMKHIRLIQVCTMCTKVCWESTPNAKCTACSVDDVNQKP